MKLNSSNYRLQSQNKHLLDILSVNYYLELGVIDLKQIGKLLKGQTLNLIDFIYPELANEGVGQISKKLENDVFYQVNYLVNLRQKSSTDKFFLTYSILKYKTEENGEKYAPIVLIPIEIDYHNFKIVISGEPVVNQLLLHYISKHYKKSNDKAIDAIESFINPRLNTIDAIDRYVLNLSKRTNLEQTIYNYITVAKVEYHDYVVNPKFFSLDHSIYEYKPADIYKEFYSKTKAILPTNIYQKYVLLKVLTGQNFAVTGKLGSGKTYTAINVIADQLAKNKKILYVNQDIDNLYEMEYNLNILGLGDATYNFSKNLNNIEIPNIKFYEPTCEEFDFTKIEKLENFGDDYEIKYHGFSKKSICEELAIIKRNYSDLSSLVIEEDLEQFEVNRIYNGLIELENALKTVDSYEINCWNKLSVTHNNIFEKDIIQRTKDLAIINNELNKQIAIFIKKFKMNFPYSISDLHRLISGVFLFSSTPPLRSWLDYTTRLKAKNELRILQSLVDENYSNVEYYENNIEKDYKINTIEKILEKIYGNYFSKSESEYESNEIYINRLLQETSKVRSTISIIDNVVSKIIESEEDIKKLFMVESVEPYIYNYIEKLNEFLSNNVILNRWYYLYKEEQSELMRLITKAKKIHRELSDIKSKFIKYLIKEEYAEFAYIDEIAKSALFKRNARKYFDFKKMKYDKVSYDNLFSYYSAFYNKTIELNQSIADMSIIKKYSSEYQYNSFNNFVEYMLGLSKAESRAIKIFFNYFLTKNEEDKEKIAFKIRNAIIVNFELTDLIKKLRYFKIEIISLNNSHRLKELKDAKEYLNYILNIESKLRTIFKLSDFDDINYLDILELSQRDKKHQQIMKKIKEKEDIHRELFGSNYLGLNTNIIDLSKSVEYLENIFVRFNNKSDIDQIFDENIFKKMLDEIKKLDEVYTKWYTKFKLFSMCFKGGKGGLQSNPFVDNNNLIATHENKIDQIKNVLVINEWLKTLEEFGLFSIAENIREGKLKDNIAIKYKYSTLEKNYKILNSMIDNKYNIDNFLKDLDEYNNNERDFCSLNIKELQNKVAIEKRNNRLNSIYFNHYNHFVETLESESGIFLCDLNVFNNYLKIDNFDLVIIDDGHLASANKYNRIKECRQVVVFGDHTFHSSILNVLIHRINDSSIVNYNYRYIPMSSKFKNYYMSNNQYILSSDVRIKVDRISGYEQFAKNIIDIYYLNTNVYINVIVGNEISRRKIYSILVDKLSEFYNEQDIMSIFNYKIKILDSFNECGRYADYAFFYYNDFINSEEVSKELMFKNFTIVKKDVYVDYIENVIEEKNELIEKEIDGLIHSISPYQKPYGIVLELLKDLSLNKLNAFSGIGLFDIIIKKKKPLGIIIRGRKEEFIYSNIHEFNFYYNEYKKFGWETLIIEIEDLINDYDNIIQKIKDICRKEK